YYIIGFGKFSQGFPIVIVRALLWSGVIVALFALLDAVSSWNPWHTAFAEGNVHRVTSTFKSPFDLGTFLGVPTVCAFAVLVFRGPAPLRLPALMLVPLANPATFLTYSRWPIIAEIAAVVLLLVPAGRPRWGTVFVLFLVGTFLYAGWGVITSSTIYA